MNKQEVIILHGLPASGKTTWAKQFVTDNINYKRLSRDDFRHMLDNYSLDPDLEKSITNMIHDSLKALLKSGWSVIIDNTNLRPAYIKDYMKVIRALPLNVNVSIKSFADISYDELIRRDSNRENKVGKEVIDRMLNQLKENSIHSLQKVIDNFESTMQFEKIEQNEDLFHAIVCDIDGTLAHMNGKRGPYDWKNVGLDDVDENIKLIVNNIFDYSDFYECAKTTVILVSGRDGSCYEETRNWLRDNGIKFDALFMRKEGDQRKDSIIKYDIFKEHIENKYFVDFVLDDRNQTVDMWRQIGLKCLQVAPGDF